MAAVVTVSNGNVIDASDINQFGSAFNAVLGVSDTAQDALGRIVLPKATSAPGTPSTAMLYVKTNEGVENAGGRLYMRHSKNGSGAAVWVPYVPIRQIVKATTNASLSTTSTSFVDITNATVSITTTGGRLRIRMVSDDASGATIAAFGGGTNGLYYIRAVVASTNLAFVTLGATTASLALQQQYPEWVYQPVAGTYTVKLQASVAVGTTTVVFSGMLLVEEYGD